MAEDLQARAERLAASAPVEFPPSVKLAEGEQIVGVLQRVEWGPAAHRGMVPIAIFQEPVGGAEFAVWLLHNALRNEMKRARPTVGDLVLVRCLGMKDAARGGDPYMNYEVRVDRPDGASVDWDQVPGGDDDEAQAAAQAAVPHRHPPTGDVCPECGAAPDQAHEMWCSHG